MVVRAWVRGPIASAPTILRCVFTAVVAWQVCVWLGAHHAPVYAVVVPLVAMRSDPFSALNVSGSRVIGVMGGVVLGIATLHVLPLGIPALVIVLLVGLIAGSVHPRGGALNIQFGASALLVLAAASSGADSYAWNRLWETAAGAVVTIVLSAVLVPPNPLRAVRRTLDELAAGVGGCLQRLAQIRDHHQDHAAVDTQVSEAGRLLAAATTLSSDLQRASKVARVAPLQRRHRAALDGLAPRVMLARSLSRHLEVFAVAVDDVTAHPEYRDRWLTLRPTLISTIDPLQTAVGQALTGRSYAAEFDAALRALLDFRSSVTDPIGAVVRHPLRRMLDDLAAHDGRPALDLS